MYTYTLSFQLVIKWEACWGYDIEGDYAYDIEGVEDMKIRKFVKGIQREART